MYFQVESSRFLGKLRRNMLRESNDETRDPHLSANVEKLRQNSLDQMAISQYALQLACGGLLLRIAILLANFGQVREIDHRCNREKNGCDYEIRQFYCVYYRSSVRFNLCGTHGGELRL